MCVWALNLENRTRRKRTKISETSNLSSCISHPIKEFRIIANSQVTTVRVGFSGSASSWILSQVFEKYEYRIVYHWCWFYLTWGRGGGAMGVASHFFFFKEIKLAWGSESKIAPSISLTDQALVIHTFNHSTHTSYHRNKPVHTFNSSGAYI